MPINFTFFAVLKRSPLHLRAQPRAIGRLSEAELLIDPDNAFLFTFILLFLRFTCFKNERTLLFIPTFQVLDSNFSI